MSLADSLAFLLNSLLQNNVQGVRLNGTQVSVQIPHPTTSSYFRSGFGGEAPIGYSRISVPIILNGIGG